jgi:hypothetical protein
MIELIYKLSISDDGHDPDRGGGQGHIEVRTIYMKLALLDFWYLLEYKLEDDQHLALYLPIY